MTIREKDGEFCAESEDGSQSFGCFPTREKAEERLAEVEFFKTQRVDDLGQALKEAIGNGQSRHQDRASWAIDRAAHLPGQGKKRKPPGG